MVEAVAEKRSGIPMIKINTGAAAPQTATADNANDESYEETLMNPEGFFNDDNEQVRTELGSLCAGEIDTIC